MLARHGTATVKSRRGPRRTSRIEVDRECTLSAPPSTQAMHSPSAATSPPPRRPSHPPASPGLLALMCLALFASTSACSRVERTGPRWIHLAQGHTPQLTRRAEPQNGGGGAKVRMVEGDGGVWLEVELDPDAWHREMLDDQWAYARPLDTGFANFTDETVRLSGPDGPYALIEPPRKLETKIERLGFFMTPNAIHLRVAPGATPPPAVFATFVASGHAEAGAWRTAIGGESGEGFSVWPGWSEHVETQVPPATLLRFRTAFAPFEPAAADTAPTRFTLLVDDDELWSFEVAAGEKPGADHEVALPAAARARLEFRVDGPPGIAAFFGPVLGPREVGTYAARPWGAARPNIVIFLIDTFRADNLAAYGGAPDVAPALNRFERESLCFTESYATASWTLPSHASMMCGALPPQHGATNKGLLFSGDLTTIAEVLAEHGYRTGAVTDSGFIGRTYGFDQGMEWFDETDVSRWDLTRTFEQSLDFLARDDGRPVFLYVHTYRTHVPYRQGEDEDLERWKELVGELAIGPNQWDKEENKKLLARHAPAFRELYLDGVRSLDREFDPWFEALKASGLFEQGYFFLTSDHGEAFCEHGEMLHGGILWEEKIRVPIVLYGSGIEARRSAHEASLVDFARTVADLTGIESPSTWYGRSLRKLDTGRPVFAYGSEKASVGRHFAVREGTRKLHAPADPTLLEGGEYERAFDLAQDPGEHDPVAGDEWPSALAREVAPLIRIFGQSLVSADGVSISPEMEAALKDIGYAGEDDEE